MMNISILCITISLHEEKRLFTFRFEPKGIGTMVEKFGIFTVTAYDKFSLKKDIIPYTFIYFSCFSGMDELVFKSSKTAAERIARGCLIFAQISMNFHSFYCQM